MDFKINWHMKSRKFYMSVAAILLIILLFLTFSFSFSNTVHAKDIDRIYVEYTGEKDNVEQQKDSDNYVVIAVLKNGKTKKLNNSKLEFEFKGNEMVVTAFETITTEYYYEEEFEIDTLTSTDDVSETQPIPIEKPSEKITSSQESIKVQTKPQTSSNNTSSVATSSKATSSAISSEITSSEVEEKNEDNSPPYTPPVVVISKMNIVTPPTKTTYLQGDVFDTGGLVIEVTFSNGTTKKLENIKLDDKKLMPADKAIIITYKYQSSSATCEIPITVTPRTPTAFKIITLPTKTDYIEDMDFDTTGMIVKIEFDNGDITDTGYTIPTHSLVLDQKEIKVSYTENNVTFDETINITVVKKTPLSLAIEGTPVKQIEDIPFNPAELTVKATCDNGKTYNVTDYTFDKKILSVGADTIKFSYKYNETIVTANLNITVVKKTPTSLQVVGTPVKQIEDISFRDTGLTVKATCDNGKTYPITGYTFDKKVLSVGADTIKFSYEENGEVITTDFDIDVENKSLLSMVVITEPTKTTYIEDTVFDKTGMSINGIYDNGITYPVTTFTIPTEELTLGNDHINVSCSDNSIPRSVKQNITVVKKTPLSLAIEGTPVTQIEDIPFNPTDLTVKATCDNGKTYNVTDFTFDKKILNVGFDAIKFSYKYNEKIVTFDLNITVVKKTPLSLTVEGTPVKQIEGLTFKSTGLIVKATCDNGKTYNVTGYSFDKKVLSVGADTIKFSYEENGKPITFNLDINVEKKTPTLLTITQQPTITAYNDGIRFKPSGMIITASYDNNTTADVTALIDYSKDRLIEGMTALQISYTENNVPVTVNLPITVGKQQAIYEKYNCALTQCTNCRGTGRITSSCTCSSCGGSGRRQYTSSHTCGTCNGAGENWFGTWDGGVFYPEYTRPCGSCGGSGSISDTYTSTCNSCSGSGSVSSTSTCTTCKGTGNHGYQKGTFITDTNSVDENTYPNNARHSDGFWYVLKKLIQDADLPIDTKSLKTEVIQETQMKFLGELPNDNSSKKDSIPIPTIPNENEIALLPNDSAKGKEKDT